MSVGGGRLAGTEVEQSHQQHAAALVPEAPGDGPLRQPGRRQRQLLFPGRAAYQRAFAVAGAAVAVAQEPALRVVAAEGATVRGGLHLQSVAPPRIEGRADKAAAAGTSEPLLGDY